MKNKSIISSFVKKVLNINSYKIYSQDYILEEEKEFFTNKYMGLSKNDYKYKKGSIPILISAPHSVKQIRNDELKPADIYTGAIIKTLGKTTNAHIIYKTHTKDDENHTDESTAYRKKIKEIINLIENLLKENGKYIKLDYKNIALDVLNDDIITSFKKKIQCFRHSSEEAIKERQSFTENQKKFIIDYGIMICNLIYYNRK